MVKYDFRIPLVQKCSALTVPELILLSFFWEPPVPKASEFSLVSIKEQPVQIFIVVVYLRKPSL
jgi:hypothetical protein